MRGKIRRMGKHRKKLPQVFHEVISVVADRSPRLDAVEISLDYKKSSQITALDFRSYLNILNCLVK